MMKTLLRVLALMLPLALVLPTVAGDHSLIQCDAWDDTTLVAVPPEPAPGGVYFVHDASFVNGHDFLFSVWVYAEANGENGLQRHDGFCATSDAYASGEKPADLLLF